jgi:hypothetical protein
MSAALRALRHAATDRPVRHTLRTSCLQYYRSGPSPPASTGSPSGLLPQIAFSLPVQVAPL